MEIRQLKAFLAIAELGTFTAAAGRVHVTQAAISMQIRQLETEVGAQLFVRAPRRVILTEAGESLFARAQAILREHDAAIEEIASLTGAHRGRLRIGSASARVNADPLPLVLREVKKKHPGAEVSVASGTSEELVQQILGGELDVAFVSLPVEARGIQTTLLSEDYLVAIASPRHKLARQRVVSAYSLAGEKLILGEAGRNRRSIKRSSKSVNNISDNPQAAPHEPGKNSERNLPAGSPSRGHSISMRSILRLEAGYCRPSLLTVLRPKTRPSGRVQCISSGLHSHRDVELTVLNPAFH